MTTRIKTWHRFLTKSELVHLMEIGGVHDLEGMKKNFEKQEGMRSRGGDNFFEPCWDCWHIEQKLKDKGVL